MSEKKNSFTGKSNMIIVTFHIPPQLLEVVDRIVKELHYSNRSEFLREAVRFYINFIIANRNKALETKDDKIIFKPLLVF